MRFEESAGPLSRDGVTQCRVEENEQHRKEAGLEKEKAALRKKYGEGQNLPSSDPLLVVGGSGGVIEGSPRDGRDTTACKYTGPAACVFGMPHPQPMVHDSR